MENKSNCVRCSSDLHVAYRETTRGYAEVLCLSCASKENFRPASDNLPSRQFDWTTIKIACHEDVDEELGSLTRQIAGALLDRDHRLLYYMMVFWHNIRSTFESTKGKEGCLTLAQFDKLSILMNLVYEAHNLVLPYLMERYSQAEKEDLLLVLHDLKDEEFVAEDKLKSRLGWANDKRARTVFNALSNRLYMVERWGSTAMDNVAYRISLRGKLYLKKLEIS